MKKIIVIAFCLVLGLGVLLYILPDPKVEMPPQIYPTYDEFVKTIQFPYVAPDDRRNKIVEGYAYLRIGMPSSQVLEHMGVPDYQDIMQGKESDSRVLVIYNYILLAESIEAISLQCQSVVVYLENEMVTGARPQKVEGLVELRSGP